MRRLPDAARRTAFLGVASTEGRVRASPRNPHPGNGRLRHREPIGRHASCQPPGRPERCTLASPSDNAGQILQKENTMTRSLARRASRAPRHAGLRPGPLGHRAGRPMAGSARRWRHRRWRLPRRALSDGEVLSALNVCAGGPVDAIQLVSNYRNFPKRGGNGGGCQQIRFNLAR